MTPIQCRQLIGWLTAHRAIGSPQTERDVIVYVDSLLAAEREAAKEWCAKAIDSEAENWRGSEREFNALRQCAAAIRARNAQPDTNVDTK